MTSTLPAWETVREYQGNGEFGGDIALHVTGHDMSDDEVTAYAWFLVVAEEIGFDYVGACRVTFDPPRRVWMRKVPNEYGWTYQYQGVPGRGAKAVTVVDFTGRWAYRCDLPGCERHYVRGGAQIGFPVSQCIDPPVARQDERFVYMCRRHADSFSKRLDEARRAALATLAEVAS